MGTSFAIGMTHIGRDQGYVYDSIKDLRRAGFDQNIHVFSEPHHNDLSAVPNITVHQNEKQRNCYPNWRHTMHWLLDNTDAQWLLIVQDDVVYRDDAAERFQSFIDKLPGGKGVGFISLYTSRAMIPKPLPKTNTWVDAKFHNRAFWGALAIAIPRGSAERLRAHPPFIEHAHPRKVDVVVGNCMRKHFGLRTMVHSPSLADHIGSYSSLGRHKVKGISWGRRGFRFRKNVEES